MTPQTILKPIEGLARLLGMLLAFVLFLATSPVIAAGALVCLAWRYWAYVRGTAVPAEIVGWTRQHDGSDAGNTPVYLYFPTVSFQTSDGAMRQLIWNTGREEPVWPPDQPLRVRYVMKPWFFASPDDQTVFIGHAVGLLVAGLSGVMVLAAILTVRQ